MAYHEREYTEDELRIQEELKAQYPYLVANEKTPGGKKMSGWARGAKNIRRMLNHNFPGVKFKVNSDTYSNGSSIYIYWTTYDNAPNPAKVNSLVGELFSSRRFDGMTDCETFDNDKTRKQFRELFGGAGYITPQPIKPNPEELARQEEERIEVATKPARSKSRGMRL